MDCNSDLRAVETVATLISTGHVSTHRPQPTQAGLPNSPMYACSLCVYQSLSLSALLSLKLLPPATIEYSLNMQLSQ